MSYQFDHLVHFVADRQNAIQLLRQNGVHTVKGGEHESKGTCNALSYFGLSYIEFLAVYDQQILEGSEHEKYSLFKSIITDKYREGFSRIAIRTNQIEQDAEYFAELGLTVSGPVPLSRRRPDGSLVRWQMLYIGDEEQELALPFLIQWEESDEEREKNLRDWGVIAQHPAGDLAISFVALAVRDLDRTVTNWAKWLGLQVKEEFVEDSLQARCKTLQLPGGNLTFCSPTGAGVVSEVLKTDGERPFLVALSSGSETEDRNLLGGIYRF